MKPNCGKRLLFVPCSQPDASTEHAYRQFLRAKGRLGGIDPTEQAGQLRLRYRRYLEDARGLAPATIAQHLETIDVFLSSSLGSISYCRRLRPNMSKSTSSATARQVRRQTLQHKVAHLRAFLRYCADRGETSRGLDRIDTPRTYRGSCLPAHSAGI